MHWAPPLAIGSTTHGQNIWFRALQALWVTAKRRCRHASVLHHRSSPDWTAPQIDIVARLPCVWAGTFRQAEAKGIEVLAGVFHADHRELVSHQNDWPFEIVNYMELIGQSLGLYREDLFKRMKLMQDADAIMADARDMIETHGLNADEVREVILSDIIGEQKLPRDRSRHPAA